MAPDSTIEITLYDCNHCDKADGPTFHDSNSCEGPVISVGGQWRCGDCGVQITPRESCFDCGTKIVPKKLSKPIDLRPVAAPHKIEQAIHKETNRHRRANDSTILSYNDHLSAIALQHSRDMATRNYFNHDSPGGEGPDDRYRRFGHDVRSVGENIAYRQPGPAADAKTVAKNVVDGWMNSTGHRKNLLKERFTEEGIGVYCVSNGTVYVTQNFR